MPIVDIAQPDITSAIDTPKGFVMTPGAKDVDHGSDAPQFSSVLGAAFRDGNLIGSYISAEDRNSPIYQEPGFKAWDTIKGTKYEKNWSSFVDVRNTQAADEKKRQLDKEDDDRRTLEAAPWYQSIPAQIAAGVADLPTLIPGGAFMRSASGGISIARTAALTAGAGGVAATAQEAGLQKIQSSRPLSESAVNIGASVLLSGILGAAGGRILSKAEWDGAVLGLERELAGETRVPVEGSFATSAGAAAMEPTSKEGNAIAGKMASGVAAATARLNPALRILQSPSAATRDIGTNLFENSVYLKKNLDGIASEPAAETLMKEWNGGLAKAIKSTDESYAGYVKGGGEMSRSDFREAVGKAMRREDASDIPEVDKVAKAWRAQVFDPLKNRAIEAKLLPPDVSVETAASYFTRMWNRNKLIAREGEFKQITARWVDSQYPRWVEDFDRDTIQGASKLKDEKLRDYQTERRIEREARFGDPKEHGTDVANEVFNTLTGKVERGVRPEFMTINSRGPMKERTFNIPDHLVEDFLEHDVDLVGRRYTRVMGADVELAGKFGTPDMKDAIQKVRDDYAKLRTGLDNEKQLMKLGEAEKADIRDLEALRDLLRGTRQESPIERNYGRIVRGLNHVNYIRSMGEVVLASITDAVRPAMVHGLGQFLQTIPQLATNLKGIKLSVAEAKLAGNVAEGVLGHRLATISEIIDPYASRGPVESFLENMTNVGSKWNGIRIWTDAMKSIASVMTQDRIIKGALGFEKIKAKEKSYLAFLGIDQSMAGRISKQFETHGETVNGVRVANTEEWSDAVAVRTYRAAMNKDVDSIIVQKSVADVPLFASTPTGRALLQFKSFALASHQKVLLRGLQEDQSRFVGGTIAMTAMGMLITYLKALSGNRPETAEKATSNPGWWIGEGLDRSGILSVPMEIANTFEKASGFNPVKSPLRALDDEGSISQKNQNRSLIGSIAGPSAGFIDDAATAASIPNTLYKGEDITKGQKGAAERLLPFNSYSGIRQMLRYVINPQD